MAEPSPKGDRTVVLPGHLPQGREIGSIPNDVQLIPGQPPIASVEHVLDPLALDHSAHDQNPVLPPRLLSLQVSRIDPIGNDHGPGGASGSLHQFLHEPGRANDGVGRCDHTAPERSKDPVGGAKPEVVISRHVRSVGGDQVGNPAAFPGAKAEPPVRKDEMRVHQVVAGRTSEPLDDWAGSPQIAGRFRHGTVEGLTATTRNPIEDEPGREFFPGGKAFEPHRHDIHRDALLDQSTGESGDHATPASPDRRKLVTEGEDPQRFLLRYWALRLEGTLRISLPGGWCSPSCPGGRVTSGAPPPAEPNGMLVGVSVAG